LCQELLVLTVVEDQQAREWAFEGRPHQPQLGIVRQGIIIGVQRQLRHVAARSKLGGDRVRIGKAEPEHTASEKLPISVDKLACQLRFADTADAADGYGC